MPLSPATQVGPYRIEALLGAGGMGEVYRARDPRLNRTVALKALPADKLADPERRRRFVQEAQSASGLNHANIITIHDILSQDGAEFLVMEYVPGKTLEHVIPKKGLRLNEALRYAIQIADALVAAHGAGIVHRDLKPANVMVTDAGVVKLLDFGLAKLQEPIQRGEATMTVQTREGTIAGTVSYMSPEQAEAKPLDARSDIFSFGCVLYEMLTGRRAFNGDSSVSTLSAILRDEPKPATQIAPELPREVDHIIRRCLRKLPARRYQHVVDLKIALDELKEDSESSPSIPPILSEQRKHARKIRAVAGVVTIAAALAGAWWWRSRQQTPAEAAMTVTPFTSYTGDERFPSFSPDGNQIAFSWTGESANNSDIYVRLIGPGTPLRLTSDTASDFMPVWSPDGKYIAFSRVLTPDTVAIMLVPSLGGPERKLAELPVLTTIRVPNRMAWTPDSKFICAPDRNRADNGYALTLFATETGEKRRLMSIPAAPAVADSQAAFAPSGSVMLFTRWYGGAQARVFLMRLGASYRPDGEPVPLTHEGGSFSEPAWMPDSKTVLFTGKGTNSGVWRVDVTHPEKKERVTGLDASATSVAVAATGRRLAYTVAVTDSNLWRLPVDGKGGAEIVAPSSRQDTNPQFSPDGKRVAFASMRTGAYEIWTADVAGSNAVQLTTFGRNITGSPRWSGDGRRIVFDSSSSGQYEVYVIAADGGTPTQLTDHPSEDAIASWSHDGRYVYFESNRTGRAEIWKVPASGGDAVQVTRNGGWVAFESADGEWLYYTKEFAPTTLWRMRVGGGAEERVLEGVHGRSFGVGRTGVYYMDVASDRRSIIRYVDLGGGRSREIVRLSKPPALGFAVSSDEKWLMWSQADRSDSDIMLVDNFR